MHKVIVERPRWGSSMRNRKTGVSYSGYDPERDYGPSRTSSSRFRLPNPKMFTDVLSPLFRFLQKQLGRPWTKVWSEIRQGVDCRTVPGRHVLDHVRMAVTTDLCIGRDRVFYDNRTGRPVDGFHVHPKTGLLRWTKREKGWIKKKAAGPPTCVAIDDASEFVQSKGIWYIDAYRVLDPEDIVGTRTDPLTGRVHPLRRRDLPDAPRRALVRRKQANRKELAALRRRLDLLSK